MIRMTRRDWLWSAAALAPAALGSQAARERPNVIFLLTDDQRWDSLGCMGNRIVQTPHIDQMAGSGVVFNNHFVSTAICMTSRASIFSGLYASSHHINDFATPFSEPQFAGTYPEMMRSSGYHTGFIGKYGVGNRMPADRFDYWGGFPGQGHYFPKGPGGPHLTQIMGDQSQEFLERAPKGKPFCLSVSFKAPHVQDEDPNQFLHSPATAGLYRHVRIPVPETADPQYISQLPVEVQRSEARRRWAVRFGTPELYQESVKRYYRLITEVDTVVGRVRAALKRSGQDGNTVVVYSADNGFYLSEHGLAGKWFMHEESIRTPLIIYDPRLPNAARGRRIDQMTLNLDLAPTLLEVSGLRPLPSMQGRSAYDLIENRPGAWRREWFYEQHFMSNGWIPKIEGVRGERWKYARYTNADPEFEEMYDLVSDPKEKNNLAKSEKHAGQLQMMRRRHQAWRERFASWSPNARWTDPPV
jgi:arylsulfatase A-like enzyme